MIIRLARAAAAINDIAAQHERKVRAEARFSIWPELGLLHPARIAEAETISPSFSAKERSLTKAFWVSAAVHASRRSPRAALEPPSCRLTSIARASRARRLR